MVREAAKRAECSTRRGEGRKTPSAGVEVEADVKHALCASAEATPWLLGRS